MRQQSFTITDLFDWFLKIFIFILPIAYMPDITQYGLQMLIFNYGTIIMFAMSFLTIQKNRSYNTILPVVLLFSLFIVLVKNPQAFSIHLFQLLLAIILYKSIIECVGNVNKVCNFFIYCIFLNIAFLTFQMLGHDLVYVLDPKLGWQTILLSHPGLMGRNYHLAFFIMMCLPLAFHKNKFIGVIFLIVLLLQKSFATYLGAMVGLSLYFINEIKFTKRNVIVGLILIVLLILAASNYNYHNLHIRTDIWFVLGKEILMNPFFGSGLGSFDQQFLGQTIDGTVILSSYSEYIRAVAEIGFFPVLICFIIFRKMLFRWFGEARKDKLAKSLFCGCMSLLIVMIFHETLKFTRIGVPFIVLMALCEARINQVKTKEIGNEH